MKQQYEHTFLYFILIYIVNLTYNDTYKFLSLIVEVEISHVSTTTFLIHQFQFLTNVPLKIILINEIYCRSGYTAMG